MLRLRTMLSNQSGAAAAEYALACAIIGAALTFGALALGNEISNSVSGSTECVAATTIPPPEC
jgi:Flp pilus assembly pilin Flp